MPQFVQFLLYSVSSICFLGAIYYMIKSTKSRSLLSRRPFNPVEFGFGLVIGYMGLMIFLLVFLDHVMNWSYADISTLLKIMFYPFAAVFFLALFTFSRTIRGNSKTKPDDQNIHPEDENQD